MPETPLNRLTSAFRGPRGIRMADGKIVKAAEYIATIEWEGEAREVHVLALPGGIPLIGVELLADNLLTIDMTDGGEVTIEPR